MNNPFKDQNRTGLVVALLVLVALLVACLHAYSVWQSEITIPAGQENRDYIGQAWSAFTSDSMGLLFGETEGSAPFLKFFALGLIWIWASHILGRFYVKYQRWHGKAVIDKLYWSSFAWCIYATIFVMMAWIFGAATQHFGWYACYPKTIAGVVYNCYPGEEGTMDKVTHWLSPSAVFVIIATVNLKDLLGLRYRLGRILELSIFVLFLAYIIIAFENLETGNPAVYVNVLWNSITDMLAGFAGIGFQAALYNLIVPYEE